jgi:hypothetical protein
MSSWRAISKVLKLSEQTTYSDQEFLECQSWMVKEKVISKSQQRVQGRRIAINQQ